jgi:competence protein ComEC
VTTRAFGLSAHWFAAGLCLGLASANAARVSTTALGLLALGLAGAAALTADARLCLLVLALAVAGWWWGSVRLTALDRSVLLAQAGRAELTRLVVTAPTRRGRFEQRVPASVIRFGVLSVHEPVLLELPLGRAPPQGAVLDVLAVVKLPRGPAHGFDERAWLRRHGVHVVLQGDRWRLVGRRGGLGGLADRLRARLGRTATPGLHGERRAVLAGVVLGDDQGLSDELRQRFRASGLYHLLAVSGQNVALVAGGALLLAWLAGLPRWLGELGALASIAGYVLAVGAQPSVVRAGVAGALGSLAWLTARERDRWHFLLLGAAVLLAWNPYNLLDAGFQLSFAAVVAIFELAPRIERRLEGYPVPRALANLVAVSTACGTLTAPVLWLQFHTIPLLSVPANALAAPAVVPLLGLALASAALWPLAPGAATALAWLNGWCAAYLAACARLVGGLPFAQVRSGRAITVLAAGALAAAAYAWRRGHERAEARLPADG